MKYAGIYIETTMGYYNRRSVMVIEQVEYTNAESFIPLLKVLYPLLLDAFTNRLNAYGGQSTEVGIYLSDKPYKTQIDYTPETFFTCLNSCKIVTVASDMDVTDTDAPNKIVFNARTCESISGSPYIDKICALESGFRSAIESRAETIKYLREFEPEKAFKWYYTTGYYQKLCLGHCRRLIIDVLSNAIKNLNSPANMSVEGKVKHESMV